MSRKARFVFGFIGSMLILPIYLVVDIALNGEWLKELHFTWGRVFTTRHGIALLYYKSISMAVVSVIVVSLFTGVILAIRGDKS